MARLAHRIARRALLAAQRGVRTVSRIGTAGLSEQDARYILMSNYLGMVVIAALLLFALFYFAYSPIAYLPLTLTLIAAAAAFVFSIWIEHRGLHVTASLLKAVAVTLALLQNEWYLGRSLGASQFFFAAVPGMFLILPPSAKKTMFAVIVLFAVSFMASRVYFTEPQIPVDEAFLRLNFLLCTLGTFTLLGLFFFLFYKETHRVELLREQAELRNLEQYREVVDNVLEGVFRTSHDGSIINANPALAQMLGHASVPELLRSVTDFRHQVFAESTDRRALQKILDEANRVTAFEMQILRRDGSRFEGSLSTRTIRDEQGEILAYDGILVDISERKRSEQLALEREVAEAATQAKSEFLAKMSHEIRTPMNAVIGFTDLALQSDSAPRRLGYLEQIRSASHSLLAIINDILDISKIEAGKLVLESREFRLQPLLEKLSDMFAVQAAQKGIEVVLAAAPELPRVLRGDPLRLEQVLINLVNNAIKFTERGEVELRVTLDASTHRDREASVPLQFSVRDTGMGIAPDKAATLFSAFTQADNSITRRFGGTGLGLAICKQLVDMMGGRISLDSMPGIGSTFRFSLPFGLVEPATESAQALSLTGELPLSLRDLPVLLVDDNLAARQVYEETLRSLHFRPLAVASAAEAYAVLHREAWGFVLIDWQMPEIDGVEASRRIHRERPGVPILLMTAYGREDLMKSAEGAGIAGFLRKPVKGSELVDTLMSVLRPEVHKGLAGAAATPAIRHGSLRGAGILLVEDNALNQRLAGELLRGQGAVVEIANNGEQAVAAVERMPFDLVLMDVQMPVMDGIEATRRIRASGRHAALPIVAMTANAMDSDRRACLAAGMNDFIAKPIDIVEVLAILGRWLQRVSVAAELPEGAPAIAVLLPELPAAVDLADAQRRMGAQIGLLPELLRGFAREHAGDALELRRSLDAGEFERAQRQAHTLKGIAANLSLRGLQADALALEIALREQAYEQARQAIERIERGVQELLAALSACLPSAHSAAASVLDRAAFVTALNRLQALLQASSFDADAHCQSLQPSLEWHLGAETARRILDPLARFEFASCRAVMSEAARGAGFELEPV